MQTQSFHGSVAVDDYHQICRKGQTCQAMGTVFFATARPATKVGAIRDVVTELVVKISFALFQVEAIQNFRDGAALTSSLGCSPRYHVSLFRLRKALQGLHAD